VESHSCARRVWMGHSSVVPTLAHRTRKNGAPAFAKKSAAVDERGYVASTESVVNIYYADIRGARVHHS
jgi:hypothetical protein